MEHSKIDKFDYKVEIK